MIKKNQDGGWVGLQEYSPRKCPAAVDHHEASYNKHCILLTNGHMYY
jgi:hypothetical protein